MTIRIVKSSQFGNIAKQAGGSKQAGRNYFSNLLKEQAESLRAGWQKKSKRVCSSKH